MHWCKIQQQDKKKKLISDVAEWSPLDLGSKLILWLDAKGLQTNTDNIYGTVDAGNNVSAWKDLSGNGYNFTQAVGANQPLFNGIDNILFNGISDFLDGTIAGLLAELNTNVQGDIFNVLSRFDGLSTGMAITASFKTQNNDFWFPAWHSDDALFGRFYLTMRDAALPLNSIYDNPNLITKFYLINFSSNDVRYQVFIDNIDYTPPIISAGADNGNWCGDVGNINNINIGRSVRAVGPTYYHVYVKSIIYCNQELSLQERISLNNYLNARYSIY